MESDGFHALLFLLKLAVGGVAFVFWARMLAECAVEEPPGENKVIWTFLIFFGNLLGAVLYLALRRPRRYAEQGH
jgi:hypothetical protein